MRYGAVRCGTVRYGTVRYGALENSDKNGLPTVLLAKKQNLINFYNSSLELINSKTSLNKFNLLNAIVCDIVIGKKTKLTKIDKRSKKKIVL